MELQRFEHLGVLLGGLHHRFHDGFLQNAFLNAWGVVAVFLAIVKAVDASPYNLFLTIGSPGASAVWRSTFNVCLVTDLLVSDGCSLIDYSLNKYDDAYIMTHSITVSTLEDLGGQSWLNESVIDQVNSTMDTITASYGITDWTLARGLVLVEETTLYGEPAYEIYFLYG